MLAGHSWAQAQDLRKVALVIGNSSYEHAGLLANPRNDAQAMADTFRRIGFDVVETRLDVGKIAFLDALQAFTRESRRSDVAVVYYAGHGIELDGQNFLIPTDATLATDDDVEFEAVPLGLVLRAVDQARRLRLVILDACRNNPFASRMVRRAGSRAVGRGLAEVEPVGDMLVAYAARDGEVASDGDSKHSPYAEALLKLLPQPGLEIQFLFRKVRDEVLQSTGNVQRPHVYGSLGGDPIYLVPPPVEEPVTATRTSNQLELAFWQSIEKSNDVAAFEAYLRSFPQGTFTALAQLRIQALTSSSQQPLQDGSSVAPADAAAEPPAAVAALPPPEDEVPDPGPPMPREAIETALVDLDCALLELQGEEGRFTLRGQARKDDDFIRAVRKIRLIDGVMDLTPEIEPLESWQCPVVQQMGEWIVANRERQVPLAVRAVDASVPASADMPLSIEPPAEMVRGNGWMQIDVFDREGRVVHWRGGKTGAPGGLPGPRLVLVTTASEPVRGLDRPESEPVEDYLAAWDALGEDEIPADLVAEIAFLQVIEPPTVPSDQAPPPVPVARPLPSVTSGKVAVSRPLPATSSQASAAPDRRCSSILTKLTLGERLSSADRDILKNKCGG
ncbi:MAG TPA: caspase family protein [Geminicoccus sp.]|uniref:caspase family protein n=1 Tax=Geminicoccus sp. TaxID=2024832 RepID=UPI002E37E3C8|nr:caspase family protein [Geminicoccus sp.]HEX2526563.1 caspase family protein [Geminicoccus sp.]